jgi:hypothetical protein
MEMGSGIGDFLPFEEFNGRPGFPGPDQTD